VVLETILVELHLVELFYHPKIVFVNPYSKKFQPSYGSPHIIGDYSVYPLHMRVKSVTIELKVGVEYLHQIWVNVLRKLKKSLQPLLL